MNIAVLIKQVPVLSVNIGVNSDNTIKRSGVENMVNPADLNALEEALRIKDEKGASVTAITMGPRSAESVLKHAASMGADRLYLISDKAFAGSDTYATAKILSRAISYMGGFDIIFCGRRSVDGETGQVGPELAAFLDIPYTTNCVSIKTDDKNIVCRRMLETEFQKVSFSMPALITVYNSINSPRLPSISGIIKAKKMPVCILDINELGMSKKECGLVGSPTVVKRIIAKKFEKRACVKRMGLTGTKEAYRLIEKAREDSV